MFEFQLVSRSMPCTVLHYTLHTSTHPDNWMHQWHIQTTHNSSSGSHRKTKTKKEDKTKYLWIFVVFLMSDYCLVKTENETWWESGGGSSEKQSTVWWHSRTLRSQALFAAVCGWAWTTSMLLASMSYHMVWRIAENKDQTHYFHLIVFVQHEIVVETFNSIAVSLSTSTQWSVERKCAKLRVHTKEKA